MSQGFIDPDYVNVADRIQEFYGRWPEGRLTTESGPELMHVADKTFVWVQAAAYRDPDDKHPGVGTAWEPVPGPTSFTRDSELMNAETAAWGRAIVAVGIPSTKVASADEVRARAGDDAASPAQADSKRTDAQNRKLHALIQQLDKQGPPADGDDWAAYSKAYILEHYGKHSSKDLTKSEAGALIDHLEALTVPFG